MWCHFADAEELVRHAFAFGLLLQDKPVHVVLMLCWPVFVACWAGRRLLSALRWQRRAAVLACGSVAGLASGAAAGALIGWWHTDTPLLDILLLTPCLFLPAGIIISAAVVRRRNKNNRWPASPDITRTGSLVGK